MLSLPLRYGKEVDGLRAHLFSPFSTVLRCFFFFLFHQEVEGDTAAAIAPG